MKTLKQFLNTNNDKNKVFLGGTCNESKWRDELILKSNNEIMRNNN